MGLFDDEIERLKTEQERRLTEVQAAQLAAEKLTKRLEKLSKVKDWPEPGPGTVIRFSRSLAGSRKYTFVLVRIGASEKSWYITGSDNSLNLLGLSNKGNTWLEVLMAIGDNKVHVAETWVNPFPAYRYFESQTAQWRYDTAEERVDFRHQPAYVGQKREWLKVSGVSLRELEQAAAEYGNSVNEVSNPTGGDN